METFGRAAGSLVVASTAAGGGGSSKRELGASRHSLASPCLAGASSFEAATFLHLIMHLFIHVLRPTMCKKIIIISPCGEEKGETRANGQR